MLAALHGERKIKATSQCACAKEADSESKSATFAHMYERNGYISPVNIIS